MFGAGDIDRPASSRRQRVTVPIELIKSDDPFCPTPQTAVLSLYDGRGKAADEMHLLVLGCAHHNMRFAGSIGPKSAVKVVIVEKPA